MTLQRVATTESATADNRNTLKNFNAVDVPDNQRENPEVELKFETEAILPSWREKLAKVTQKYKMKKI